MDQFVIVADDDHLSMQRARSVVEQEGLIPIVVRDGKQAYKALRSNIHVVAVFLDLEMPYIPGIELIRYMKTVEALTAVPVVVINDKFAPDLLHDALAAGAIASIHKPFTGGQLRSLLRTVAGKAYERTIS